MATGWEPRASAADGGEFPDGDPRFAHACSRHSGSRYTGSAHAFALAYAGALAYG